MNLGSSVSRVGEVVGAFLGGEGSEEFTDRCGRGFERSGCGLAQEVFELGEDLLDRIQIRRVFGQEKEFDAGRPDGLKEGFCRCAILSSRPPCCFLPEAPGPPNLS